MSIYTEWDQFEGKTIMDGIYPLLSAMAERNNVLSGRNFEYDLLQSFIPSALLDYDWLMNHKRPSTNIVPTSGLSFIEPYKMSIKVDVYSHMTGHIYTNIADWDSSPHMTFKYLILDALGRGLLYNYYTPSKAVPTRFDYVDWSYYRPTVEMVWNDHFPGEETPLLDFFYGEYNEVRWTNSNTFFDARTMRDFARLVNCCTSAIFSTNTGNERWTYEIVDISDQLSFKLEE